MNDGVIRAVFLVAIFVAVALAIEIIVRGAASARTQRRNVNSRLAMIERGRTYAEAMSALRRSGSSVPAGLPPFLARMAQKVERRVQQSRINVAVPTVLIGIVAAPVAIMLLLLFVMLVVWHMDISLGRLVICAAQALIIGTVLPLMLINMKAEKMRKRVLEQFPVALDVFCRGLRAGHPVAAALELLTMELNDPIGSEFGLVVDEVTYGAQLRDALQNMAERWDSDDIRMFVVSLSVQSETGGNLAEILDNLSRVIRERQSLLMKVRALSSEGRMTALMLTVLPVFTFVLLFLMNPAFFLDVANDGMFIPGFGFMLALYLTGFFTIRRMVDLKV